MKRFLVISCLCLVSIFGNGQSSLRLKFKAKCDTLSGFLFTQQQYFFLSDSTIVAPDLVSGEHDYFVQITGYKPFYGQTVLAKGRNEVTVELIPLEYELKVLQIARGKNAHHLRAVKGTSIFAAKKSELIKPDYATSNLANNNARQLFNKVPGLNIWENDASGLQLNIGARGLNPNRTSNFNTRQNGYDISADALGYPEAYYVPPSEAVERINMVRGAAALQTGPHFGGLIDYQLKEKEDSTILVRQSLSAGSFQFLKSFTSIGGQFKNWNYYGFYQKKKGNGFQPNAQFDQNVAYLSGSFQFSNKLKLSAQYTYMDYLAQQPGGLTDAEFEQDPYQSKRERNWFKVNWNLYALILEHRINSRTTISARAFVLHASRMSVGDLSKPNRPDANRNRDLIIGEFDNYGSEARLVHKYALLGQPSTLLLGVRAYHGNNHSIQGFSTNASDANFNVLNQEKPGVSEYNHPGYNGAFFIENIFRLKHKWSVIPGLRYEAIETNAKGYYVNRLESGGRIIFEEVEDVSRTEFRHFPLLGLGVSKRLGRIEALANITQNYRSINFTDITITNPNVLVDPNLTDESGYNADLTFRGFVLKKKLWFDVSLFCMNYNNRIGIAEVVVEKNGAQQLTAYRTNIGKAFTKGIESYLRFEQNKPFGAENWNVQTFINYSYIHGRYLEGLSSFVGNHLEFVVPQMFKSGLVLKRKSMFVSYQYSAQGLQFTDSNNSEKVADATRGIIPGFQLHDATIGYQTPKIQWKLTMNNLLNTAYFSRRALSYPGPGIITGEPRSVYVSVSYAIGG